jgi:hypothetical protein
MTNAPVGKNYVNASSLIKRATRLSPETQVTLGGYCGGHPPQMVPFFAQKRNNSRALSLFLLQPRATIRTGRRRPSGRSARARDSLRRVDMALLSRLQPSRPPRENRTPLTRIYSGRRRNKKRSKQQTSFQQKFMSKTTCSFTKAARPEY